MIKKVCSFLLFLVFFGMFSVTYADLWAYTISDYSTTVRLNTEWELAIHEDITVQFSEPRHGIYRDIPFRYRDDKSKRFTTKIYDVQVANHQYTTSTAGDDYRIKIGSPDYTVKGEQKYSIDYKVYGGIKNFDSYQELYRNMLGTKRNTNIKKFSFTFVLPTDLVLQDSEYYVFSGKYWEKNPVAIQKDGKYITMKNLLTLHPNEAVTLAVKLPANYVQLDWKRNFPRYYLILIFPLGVWAYLYKLWRKYGKDDNVRDVIYYTPPKGYTPWQIASIYKKNPTDTSIFATLYSWATDGYIKIKHEKWSLLSNDEFSIEKVKEKQGMQTFESLLWSSFFGAGNSFSFGKENQSYTMYTNIKTAYKWSYDSVKKTIFTPKSLWRKEKIENITILLPITMAISILWLWEKGVLSNSGMWIVSFSGIIIIWGMVWLFAKYIDKLSPMGIQLYEQVNGYKKYLEAVEEPKLQQLIKDDPQYFEKVLPFAVALGMETEWIKKCATALQNINYHPVWIYGSGFNSSNINTMTSSISSSMKWFGSASAFSAPSSSWSWGWGGFSGWGGGWGWGGSW